MTGHAHGEPVAPKSTEEALSHVKQGGRLYVSTQLRVIIVNAKTLAKFEKAGCWLLREEGDGYRMKWGRSSIYLFPGQLRYTD